MPKVEFMSPEQVERMMKLAESPYRPPQILALKAEIESETRAAELRASVTGIIDDDDVNKIVGMRLQLDGLYSAWTRGEIK